jgi:hypothetical protein
MAATTMNNNEEQVKDLLCADGKEKPWIWGMNQMLFLYKDGTGSVGPSFFLFLHARES